MALRGWRCWRPHNVILNTLFLSVRRETSFTPDEDYIASQIHRKSMKTPEASQLLTIRKSRVREPRNPHKLRVIDAAPFNPVWLSRDLFSRGRRTRRRCAIHSSRNIKRWLRHRERRRRRLHKVHARLLEWWLWKTALTSIRCCPPTRTHTPQHTLLPTLVKYGVH